MKRMTPQRIPVTGFSATAGPSVLHVVGALMAEMEANGIEQPLSQPVTLAALVADLCRLTHTPLPDDVAL